MKCSSCFVSFVVLIGGVSASLTPRIIGGENASIKDFRHQAAFRVNGIHICGGIIISDKHILTAAHCFTAKPILQGDISPYLHVRVHTGTSYNYKETGDVHRIFGVRLHPGWTQTEKSAYFNDIAVVTLEDRIVFNDRQGKIDLASHDVVSGSKGYLTGWGRTASGPGPANDHLKKLQMKLLNSKDCQTYMFPVRIRHNQICAYRNDDNGCGLGDSGGGLVLDDEVVGILSWVHEGQTGCGIPEVYTSVYAFKDFIKSAMKT